MSPLLSFLVLLGAGSQEPNPKVSFEAPGLLVGIALERLSETSGVKLMASPQTKDQTLIAWVKDVPLQDLMAKIADATAAEWVKEESGYRLIRGAALGRQHEQAHRQLEIEKVKKAQLKLRERLAKEGPFDEKQARALGAQVQTILDEARRQGDGRLDNYRQQDNVAEGLPVGRLARAIAADLDPLELAKLDQPGKIVFSLTPNRMQRPLSRSAMNLVQKLETERQLAESFLPAVAEVDFGGLNSNIYQAVTGRRVADRRLAKLLVEVRRHEYGSNLGLHVMLANAAGKVYDSAHSSLDIDLPMAGPQPNLPPPTPGETPIELSPRGTAMVEAIKKAIASQGGEFPLMPEAVRQVFLNPETHSLSELILADLVIGAAKAKGKNVVASPSEFTAFMGTVMFSTGPARPSQVLTQLRTPPMDTVMEESGDWLVIKMADPIFTKRTQFDRVAMGKMLRAADARKSISIDEAAAFAISTPPDFERQLVMMYMMLSVPEAGRVFERMSWTTLKFHGSLAQQQRQTLSTGQGLAYARLTPFQQGLFDKVIFGQSEGMSQSTRAVPSSPEEEDEGPYAESLKWQPTERYPNGLGNEALVRLAETNGEMVLAKGTYGEHFTEREFGVHDLAYHLFQAGNPQHTDPTTFTEYRHMKQRSLEYTFDGDSEYNLIGTLKERTSMSPAVKSVDQLPGDFMAKVKAQMETFRRPPSGRPPLQR